jgi:subfamily B ATP-binding cassette protein MsbA
MSRYLRRFSVAPSSTKQPPRATLLGDAAQLRRLFAFTRPYRKQLALGILGVVASSALTLVVPQIVRRFFDAFVASLEGSAANLNLIVVALMGLFLVQAGFNFLRTYMIAQVGEGVVADLRKALYRHLLGLSVRFFETRKVGEITSRLTSDAAVVQGAVSQALAQLVNQLALLVGSVVLLFVTNLQLTLLMLAVVPVVVLGARLFGSKLRRISTAFQDLIAEANAGAEEALVGVRVVKSFTAEELEAERYGERIGRAYQVALRRAAFRAAFFAGILFAMFSAIGVVLWMGGRLVVAGELSPGALVQFLLYTLFVAGAVGALTGLYSQFQEALGASRRIFELLDERSDLPAPQVPRPLVWVKGRVAFEGVSFRYGAPSSHGLTPSPTPSDRRGETVVLRDLSFVVQPGEVVALVGPSGAGKSTLVSLIPRFYDPTEGRITLDGTDLRAFDERSLRAQIGLVPQETQLFSGTVRDNIRYGRPTASDEEVEAAARSANAHDFIASFPDGYDTVVGERGVKLSGGQRQRVAIARALLKGPRILVLDEATSSLDAESEALVQEALEVLMRGRTVFVIAHRLSTVRSADRIFVLDEGRIVQEGTHEVLLAQGGLYAELYRKQFRERAAAR